MRFSIIITNYNYDRFVGQAIESALAIDWPDKEIIVVDDGSTDDSRSVIESFGERITAIFKTNGGQARAASAGFKQSTGAVVIFLDADDVLLPTVARQVMAVWKPGIAKVQYGQIYVGKTLTPLGICSPVFTGKHTPQWAARSLKETGDYLSSPTSGNAWSRGFLMEVFPLPTREEGLQWFDMYLSKLAPFFGDVISLTTPQCLYRLHGNNGTSSASLTKYIDQLNQIDTEHRLAGILLNKKNLSISLPYENEYYTKLSLIVKRVFPGRLPAPTASLLLVYWKTVRRGKFSAKKKIFYFLWSFFVVTSPRPLARWMALNRDGHHSAGYAGPIVSTFIPILRRMFR
jgi:glycosyltransferase involved in cell wall biosynthesis